MDIRVGTLRIRRLRLNSHLPEANWIADHAHRHSQILLYMNGTGSQWIRKATYPVKRGGLFFIPAGVHHAFLEGSGRRPLCLAIDLNVAGSHTRELVCNQLNSMDMNRVRHALFELKRWRNGNETVLPCEAAAVLQLIGILFRVLGLLPRNSVPSNGGKSVLHDVHRKLNDPSALEETLSSFAARIGYHPDHLNRLLKRSCGLTLGELRANVWVQKAQRSLAGPKRIAEVAMDLGFADPNYFSRWFRKQTGQTPGAWRSSKPASL
jgi:AraC family transcriptional regulator, transcriptional activator of pobA